MLRRWSAAKPHVDVVTRARESAELFGDFISNLPAKLRVDVDRNPPTVFVIQVSVQQRLHVDLTVWPGQFERLLKRFYRDFTRHLFSSL
jgi:hypothetical protein